MTAATSSPSLRRRRVRAPLSARGTLAAVTRQRLRAHRRSPLAWGGALGAMGGLVVAMWPSIETSMSRVVRGYPPALKRAFGIDELSSVEAYLDAEMLSLVVPLIVAFLAVRVITQAISSAEERGYLDTLLALPLRRFTLVAGSMAACAALVAATLAVITVLTWSIGTLAGAHPSLIVLARGIANVWPLAMFFAGLATLAAGALRRAAAVTAVSAGTLVAMYAVDLVGRMASGFDVVRWASVFRWYGSAVRDGIDPAAFAGTTLAGVALALAGALLLERRDIR